MKPFSIPKSHQGLEWFTLFTLSLRFCWHSHGLNFAWQNAFHLHSYTLSFQHKVPTPTSCSSQGASARALPLLVFSPPSSLCICHDLRAPSIGPPGLVPPGWSPLSVQCPAARGCCPPNEYLALGHVDVSEATRSGPEWRWHWVAGMKHHPKVGNVAR